MIDDVPPLRCKAELPRPGLTNSATPAPSLSLTQPPVVSPLNLDRQATSVPPTRRPRYQQELLVKRESMATSSAGGEVGRTPSKRKPSYLAQREEREELEDEVRALEVQLEQLRCQAGLPSREEKDELSAVEASNFHLEEKLHVNDLYLSRVHSMVTSELLGGPVNPLSTFIHLPRDIAERRAILRDLRDLKLRRAEETLAERLHHLDHTIPYTSEERFTTENGQYHCHRVTMTPLPNFSSVRELFDYYVHFFYNMEMAVTDLLGQLTIREDSEEIDPTIWNQRIVTTADDVGCTEELNTVGFARFYDESSGHPGAPYGIVAYDTVNVDDLYPYLPHERTCKDFQGAHFVGQVPIPDTDETVVVLKQCLFTIQLPPQFPLELDKLKQLQENCSRWPIATLKYLRDYVAPTSKKGEPEM